MKNILYSLVAVALWWTLCSSGCDSSGSGVTGFNAGNGGGAKGGSTARFTIANDRLYIVAQEDLKIFDVSNARSLVFKNKVNIGPRIETIYPFKNQLYIASSIGMYRYNISNPDVPTNRQYVQHITGCDPVVANDSLVFLTIHSGTACNGNINFLQAYRINSNNSMVFAYNINLSSPRGLGLQNNIVYVCDMYKGVYSFNATSNIAAIDSSNFKQTGVAYMDIIPYNQFLVCQTNIGLSYLDCSNPKNLSLIKQIKN